MSLIISYAIYNIDNHLSIATSIYMIHDHTNPIQHFSSL